MSMNVGGSRKMSAQMNVTPLIDVLLVLLIIFMILTPLTPQGEGAVIPQPAKQQPDSPDVPIRTVVLQVLSDPSGPKPVLKLNGEAVGWGELRARLKAVYAFRKERVIFVRAEENIDWQDVADAISEAHLAGVDREPRPRQPATGAFPVRGKAAGVAAEPDRVQAAEPDRVAGRVAAGAADRGGKP